MSRQASRDLSVPIAATAALGFFTYNVVMVTAPVYNSADEAAYLAKAAFLAGKPVDFASSWFSGYPLFLVPAFALFSQYESIWRAVLATNALLWFGSFVLLGRLLRNVKWLGEVNTLPHRNLAMLISCAYPGWFVASGYALPNSAFVFVFMIALVVFPYKGFRERWRLALYCSSISFLCWIHPIGFSIFAIGVCLLFAMKQRRRDHIYMVCLAVPMIWLVSSLRPKMERSINVAMTPRGYTYKDHYSNHLSLKRLELISTKSILALAEQVVTVTSAVVIATLGLVIVLGSKLFRSLRRDKLRLSDVRIPAFVLASTFMVVLTTSLSFFSSCKECQQLDHWIFLRYADGVLLPIFGLGFLTLLSTSMIKRSVLLLLTVLFLGFSGYILQQDLYSRGITGAFDLHFSMTAGFWPHYFDPQIRWSKFSDNPYSLAYPSFRRWYFIGVLGTALALLFRKSCLPLLMCLSLLFSPRIQTNWHDFLYEQTASPTLIDQYLHQHKSEISCVAFLSSFEEHEEIYLTMTFRLVGLNFKRIRYFDEAPGCAILGVADEEFAKSRNLPEGNICNDKPIRNRSDYNGYVYLCLVL